MGFVNQLLEFVRGGSVNPSGRAKDCRCKAAFARDSRPVNSRTKLFLGLVLHKMTPYMGTERMELLSSLICITSESGSIEKLIIPAATIR